MKKADLSDIPLLIELGKELAVEAGSSIPPFDEGWTRKIAETGLPNENVVVFLDERGFLICSVSPRLFSKIPAASISQFYLRPSYRTLANIGSFINAAKTWAQEKHADSLWWSFDAAEWGRNDDRLWKRWGLMNVGTVYRCDLV